MLTIEVVAINGAPPPVPMSARFDRDGGTIGRDPGCTLVLPDAEKRISRRHALISWRDGRFSLRNQGSAMALLLNGTPVEYGSEVPLAGGDRFDLGDFSLRATDESVGAGTVRPTPGPAAVARKDDILAGFGPSAAAIDPFADLIPAPAPVRRPAPAPAARGPLAAQPPTAAQIPDDFDPFGEPLPVRPTSSSAQSPGPRGDFSDLVPPQHERVDELFGLRGGDLFPAGHPLATHSAASTPGAVGIDDLLSPGAPAPTARSPVAPIAPVQRDDASELSARIHLPDVAPAEKVDRPMPTATEPAQDSAEGPATAGGMMVSWDQHGDDGVFEGTRTMVIRGGAAERRRAERRQSAPTAVAAPPAQEPARHSDAAARELLLHALRDGLGLERWPDERNVDAETMRRVGRLMRAAVQGTIDLLRARATIKSEVQAQMTMIVARDNNPLKFSPNVEAALAHLLGPAQRGFMSATTAMDDAYRDLVAHQFGFTAGTRAALADVLRRFDPAELEKRLAHKSMLDALLPAHRKAKLWDLFSERFERISAEAEEDFQRLFGKEFLRAYEAQVAKMSLPDRQDKS